MSRPQYQSNQFTWVDISWLEKVGLLLSIQPAASSGEAVSE